MTNLIDKIIEKKLLFGMLFFTSVILGPGVSYGSIYLFHVVLALLVFYLIIKRDHIKAFYEIIKRSLNILLLCSLLWLALSIVWAENKSYAFNYVLQFVFGVLVVLFTQFFITDKTSFNYYKNKMFFPLLLIVLAISLLEIFTNFRWPISSISFHNDWFGRENIVHETLKTENIKGYLLSSPTAFFWNQNHLAVFLSFFLPFFLKNKWKDILIFIVMIIVIVHTGSRLTIMSIGLILILISFIKFSDIRFFIYFLLTLVIPLVFNAHSLYSIKAKEPLEKVVGEKPISKITLNYFDKGSPIKTSQVDEPDNSQGIRTQLYYQGIQYLKQSKFMGVGAGNAAWHNYKQKENSQNVTSVHFYWLEIAINGGIVLLTLFFLYFGKLLLYYYKQRKKEVGYSLFVGLILFGFTVISLSSAHYFLPYYAFLGLLSAWYYINEQENEANIIVS